MIVTDETLLRRPCAPVADVREGGAVARKLGAVLDRLNKSALKDWRRRHGKGPDAVMGVGLAANQIGVLKQVAVVRVGGRRVVLMNPAVVDASSETVPFVEGCLSYPGARFDTRRHVWVTVRCLNLPEPVTFGPPSLAEWDETSLLTSVVVQHEVAHLMGLTPGDFGDDGYGF